MKLSAIRKFLFAAAGVVVAFGFVDDETAQAVVSALTAVLVYVVPNSD